MISPEMVCFLAYKRIECQASDNTLDAYRNDLLDFSLWLRGKHVASTSEKDVHRFLDRCVRQKLSPATIARKISVLREIFKFLQRDRGLRRDPMRRIVAPKGWKRIPKAIEPTEAARLLDFPLGMFQNKVRGLRDRAMIELLWAAGIRVSELTSVKLSDLDFENRTIRVFGKGSKERLAPFGLPAARALKAYLSDSRPKLLGKHSSPYLFPGRRGRALTRMRVWQMINERAAQVGMPKLSPHVMRHSCATHLVENGADLRTVQDILGHADITTTQGYLKASPAHLKKMIALHPRNNGKRHQMKLFESKLPSIIPSPWLCEECSAPAVDGRNRCEKHLTQARIARQRQYQKKRAESAKLPQAFGKIAG